MFNSIMYISSVIPRTRSPARRESGRTSVYFLELVLSRGETGGAAVQAWALMYRMRYISEAST